MGNTGDYIPIPMVPKGRGRHTPTTAGSHDAWGQLIKLRRMAQTLSRRAQAIEEAAQNILFLVDELGEEDVRELLRKRPLPTHQTPIETDTEVQKQLAKLGVASVNVDRDADD